MSYMSHLDGLDNPLALGYVHTGNIFVDGNVCRLGGFENAMFGYPARRQDNAEINEADTLDVIMFGMYQM